MHGTHRTSCREEPPTDGTDAHRCRRVWHPCHTHAAKFCVFCEFCGRIAHHNNLCPSVPSVGEKIFPQNARNSQKLLAEKSLPQMSTEHTETSCREEPPTDGTDEHRCRRVWHPCHTHAAKFCVFCEFCGRKEIPTERTETSGREESPTDGTDVHRCRRVWHPCNTHADKFCEFCEFRGRTSHSRRRGYGKMTYPPKEKSVGGHLCRRFCEFGVFCGRISHSKRRGYGKMPYPPKEKSVGEYTQQEVLCKSAFYVKIQMF